MAQQSALKIAPVHDLADSALTAFQGARYHLDALKTSLEKPGMQTLWKESSDLSADERRSNQNTLNAFHWHLRAFFWELVGAFDATLLWANARFGLGSPERNVKWGTVRESPASINADKWLDKKAVLENAWESDWFFEVREYRNFAHRSFLLIQAEYMPSKSGGLNELHFITLLPARVGQAPVRDLIDHLSEYHERMRELGERIFSS